jgi:anti-sigma-K factor RskA
VNDQRTPHEQSTPDEIENLTGAYVLDAATADERAAVEAEADRSEAVRNELTELADTAVMLGLAVEPVQPSPQLKANLMGMLDATPQLAGERRTEAEPAAEPVPAAESAAAFGPVESRARTRWFTRPVAVLTAAAAAAALVIGGVVVTNQVADQSFQQAQAEQLEAITAAADTRELTAEVAGGGTATLVWSNELGSAALMVDDIAPLPDSKTYQLWYIDHNGARPAGVFDVGDSGTSWRVLDGAMHAGDSIGLTVEPAGGSTEPTTKPVVHIVSA